MKLISEERIEKEVWDSFVKENDSGHIFQSFDWGEFKRSQGWSVHRIALRLESGELKAALSILEKNIPLLNYKIWYLPRGPVFDFKDKASVEEALDFLVDFGRKNKAAVIKISPELVLGEDSQCLPALLKNKGFREAKDYQLHKCSIRVDLKKNLQDIFIGFKKNTRWEIKKAREQGVKAAAADNEQWLKVFYRLYSGALKKDRVGPLSYDYLKNLRQTFPEKTLVLIACRGEIPVSGVFIARFGKKAWYLFGGSAKEQTYYSSQLLQWKAMEWAKDQGCQIYDLQGICCSRPKNKHERGNLQFKSGFGGERVELIGEFDYILKPRLYKFLSVLYYLSKKL